jgi:hypothetical protein
VTEDVTKSWSWNFSGLHGDIPALANPDVMLEDMKVFRIT